MCPRTRRRVPQAPPDTANPARVLPTAPSPYHVCPEGADSVFLSLHGPGERLLLRSLNRKVLHEEADRLNRAFRLGWEAALATQPDSIACTLPRPSGSWPTDLSLPATPSQPPSADAPVAVAS